MQLVLLQVKKFKQISVSLTSNKNVKNCYVQRVVGVRLTNLKVCSEKRKSFVEMTKSFCNHQNFRKRKAVSTVYSRIVD